MFALIVQTGALRKRGILLYENHIGEFHSVEHRRDYESLFEGAAPAMPYSGVGTRYGETTIETSRLREAKLESMRSHGFEPKKVDDALWAHENVALGHMEFPHTAVYGRASDIEDIIDTAWCWTGMRFDPVELKTKGNNVYTVRVSYARALDAWTRHQVERSTVTDWENCPHDDVIANLGVDDSFHRAYCLTQGEPKFVTSESDVDPWTLHAMELAMGKKGKLASREVPRDDNPGESKTFGLESLSLDSLD